jgi:hypothetical protein
MSILVNEGETVRLPCVVDRLEGFVLLWKQKVGIKGQGFDSCWLPCVMDRLEVFVLLWKQKVGIEG